VTGALTAFTVLLLAPLPHPEAGTAPSVSIRQALANLDYSAFSTQMQAPSQPAQQRSLKRKAAGALLGGLGGFVAGAFVGELIYQECDTCEPPPLPVGAMIGAPIGAIVGAMLGAKFL
jgi:hypothetical protein